MATPIVRIVDRSRWISADLLSVLATLSNSTNITIFAPSNDAIEALLATPGYHDIAAVPGYIENVLMYHVVNASISSGNFSTSPLFVPTLQNNATYSNVTGGQRIGLVLSGEGDDASAQVLSGLGMSAEVPTAVRFPDQSLHISLLTCMTGRRGLYRIRPHHRLGLDSPPSSLQHCSRSQPHRSRWCSHRCQLD